MSGGDVLTERHGPVLVLTLNRPDSLNAITYDMFEQLRLELLAAELSGDVRAVVLTGAGRAFTAGGDLKLPLVENVEMWPDRSYLGLVQRAASLVTFVEWMRTPVICMVNGLAYGVGLALVLAGDLTVAAEEARFCAPEAARNLVDPYMPRLGWRIGWERAKRMVLTAEPVPAKEAADWGLISQVVPAAELRSAAMGLAERIAGNGPDALANYKLMFSRQLPPFDLGTYFAGAMSDNGTEVMQRFMTNG